MSKMTKKGMLSAIAFIAETSQADVERVLQGLSAVATTALKEGKSLELPELGVLKPKHNAARKGRNPQTGETLDIPASHGVSFKMVTALKDALN